MKMPSPPRARAGLGLIDWLDEFYWAWRVSRLIRSDSYEVVETNDGSLLDFEPTLPGVNGAAARPLPLALRVVANESGDPRIRVYASTIAGGSAIDAGFSTGDSPPYLLVPEEGVLQAGITLDEEGAVTSRWLEIVPVLTPNSADTFYCEIGTVTQEGDAWRVSNSRYGPLVAIICRRWYSADPPLYEVTWQ